MPFRDPKTKNFYADLRPRRLGKPTGRRIRKLMPKVRTWQEAEEEERRLLREIQLELSGERISSPVFEDFANGEYKRWVKGNKKRVHEAERLVSILCASTHLKGKRLDEIFPDDIERLKADMRATISNRGTRLKPGTINTHLAELSAIFRQAVASRKARANPMHGVKYLPNQPASFCILEYHQEPHLFSVLESARCDWILPMARIALLTGMRCLEILSLREGDIDFGRDMLYVRDPKWSEDKRKTEGIPISQEVRNVLLSLPVRRGWYFSSPTGGKLRQGAVSTRFGYQAQVRAQLTNLTFHSLRHTFGTRLADAGFKVGEIMRLMGHQSPTMAARYLHPSDKSLRAAVESASTRPKVLEFEILDSGRADGKTTKR